MNRPLVTASREGVDNPEGAAGVARSEPQVLVVPWAVLAVEVDVKQLAVPQGLAVACA